MSKIFDLDKIWAYCITGTLSFFEPLWLLMLWFFIFVAVDMITGISAAIKERQLIESNKLRKTIYKLFMYCTVIVLVHAIDTEMITVVNLGLARICAAIICGIELYSILENCYRITGNDVFRILTQFTLKKIEDNTGAKLPKRKHKK
ncbi:MAG: phage holin family protein [Clostridia bacterium]|nr:phage holin family protein [Clostridia bacterium]MBQ7659867.1 phage holin family protein [Alphaproteobacteria bacterium]